MNRFSEFSNNLRLLASTKWRTLLLFLSAALSGITLIFPKIGFIEWITLIPAAIVLLCRAPQREIRLRSLYRDGFIFFYTFYLVCFHWFTYLYPLDFIDGMTKGSALLVVILAWFGVALVQALLSAFMFVLAGVLCRSRVCERIPLCRAFVIAGLWTLCEWFQTVGWWGVPWGRLTLGQSYYIIGLQNASWFGSYFVTFVLVLVNLLLAYALINLSKKSIVRSSVAIVVGFLLFQYVSGAIIYATTDLTDGEKVRVACIQGNIPSSEKWNVNSSDKTIYNYEKYTAEAAKEGAQIVVWPETAIPYNITKSEGYAALFAQMAQENNVYILVGTYVSDEDGKSLNSLVCFTPKGEQHDTVYSKRHLVPFGEYIPLRGLIEAIVPPLADLVMTTDDVYPGEGAQIIETDEGIAIGGLICFDSIYEELTLESVRDGAELICLSTNDSWFIDSAALDMHNAHAQIRAIESGRYIARAANTGISTVIAPNGNIIEQLDPLVEGKIVADVYATERTTLWSIIGNSFVYLIMIAFVCIVADRIYVGFKKKIEQYNA